MTLISREISYIEKEFPDYELPLSMVNRFDVRVYKENHRTSIVALSHHFIGCFSQKKYGGHVKKYYYVHLSKVKSLFFSDRSYIVLITDDTKITIAGKLSLLFGQLFCKNYHFSNPYYKDLNIQSSNMSLFPDINIHLSLSQMFQFHYFSQCAERNVPYYHEIVQYIHTLLTNRHGYLDIAELPSDIFDQDPVDSLVLHPLINSLSKGNSINGIVCMMNKRPALLKSLSSILSSNPYIKVVHLYDCGISEGMKELLESYSSISPQVVAWDFSYNSISNFSCFTELLSKYEVTLLHLGLSFSQIKAHDLQNLFQTMIKNRNLWKLQSLSIAGLVINNSVIEEIRKYFSQIIESGDYSLESLEIGAIKNMTGVISLLFDLQLSLKSLSLKNSSFDSSSFTYLLSYIKSTKSIDSIDISNCQITNEQLGEIIYCVATNSGITSININMSGINLHGNALCPFIRSLLICENDNKWRGFNLDNTNLDIEDLLTLISIFKELPNLESLSLSNNFHYKMEGIGFALGSLSHLSNLKKIVVSGNSSKYLGKELSTFLKNLLYSNNLVHLDISNQRIGQKYYSELLHFIENSQTIKQLRVDGNGPIFYEHLVELFYTIIHKPQISDIGFPNIDASQIIAQFDSIQMRRNISDIKHSFLKIIAQHKSTDDFYVSYPTMPSNLSQILAGFDNNDSRKPNEDLLFKHSLISEDYHIPLPYLFVGDPLSKGGNIDTIEIGNLSLYKSENMGKIIWEKFIGESEMNEIHEQAVKTIENIPINEIITESEKDSPIIDFNPQDIRELSSVENNEESRKKINDSETANQKIKKAISIKSIPQNQSLIFVEDVLVKSPIAEQISQNSNTDSMAEDGSADYFPTPPKKLSVMFPELDDTPLPTHIPKRGFIIQKK